jgi:acyl-CoA reductase-like NAD-dependent aldehyde dehydrogenase
MVITKAEDGVTTDASPSHLDVEVPGLDSLFIGGAWMRPAGRETVDVLMPSTGEVIAVVPAPSTADADAAVKAARHAFDEGPWPGLPVAERIEVCTRFADELEARMDVLNRAWAFESGYPLSHGIMINTGAAQLIWRQALAYARDLPWEEERTGGGSHVLLQRSPVGVVLGIITYNGPVPLIGMKIIPALLAGCPVIVKAAPESQLTTRLIAEAARAAGFPSGAFSMLAAGTETSKHLVGHDGIDMVHMTGGTAVAVDVVTRTAPRLARTALELGGKSPAIILDDADLDDVLPTLVPGAIGGVGQVCVALSRILVSRARYDEVVARLVDEIGKYRLGDPFDQRTALGPLGNERARQRTEAMLARAQEQGAKVAVGGRRPPELPTGFYFEPTLLREVTTDMDIAQEEVFGPITCVIAYDDVDDAVRIANDSRFGLAASVYSTDKDAALAVAKRIRSGGVAVNLAGVCLTQPFGGVRQSGWGRECGPEGILEFTDLKQILLSGSYSAS